MMNYYQKRKEAVRQEAIEWQYKLIDDDKAISMQELAEVGDYFRKLGKRYGLLKEFIENAIPC